MDNILKQQIKKEHLFSGGFRKNNKKRKLSEATRINTVTPSLNLSR